MKHLHVFTPPLLFFALTGCGGSDPDPAQFGADPPLPEPEVRLVPTMRIANPAQWGDQRPTVPPGYAITAIATDLAIPRQTLDPSQRRHPGRRRPGRRGGETATQGRGGGLHQGHGDEPGSRAATD